MARITITVGQLELAAETFRQASRESEAMIIELDEQIKFLQADWEDVTKMRFYSEYQYWSRSMQQFTQLLDGIAQQLDRIADKFICASPPWS